jgi:hypothetical protein
VNETAPQRQEPCFTKILRWMIGTVPSTVPGLISARPVRP